MRKILIILTIVFLVLSLIFVILPMGTIALLPTAFAALFAFGAFYKAEATRKNLAKWLMIIALGFFVVALGKVFLIKNEAENDKEFLQEQIQSTEEAQMELEELMEMNDSGATESAGVPTEPDSIG